MCDCTTKYAKRTRTHVHARISTCIRTCMYRVAGRDIVCLKCGRRSRLLPIHLAQDGRQIELPPETRDQRALAAFLPFLPSFLCSSAVTRRDSSSISLSLAILPRCLFLALFTLPLLAAVIGFFLCSAGRYNRRRGYLASTRPRVDRTVWRRKARRNEGERGRETRRRTRHHLANPV